MVALAVPTEYNDRKVLVADDEREHVQFLLDYLEAKGFEVTFAESATEALAAAEKLRFRAYFIDLNIPFGSGMPAPESVNATYDHYVGLHIIRAIRGQGNSGARVLAYSAHHNEQITTEIDKLYCRYVPKGRARDLKDAFDTVLMVDPLTPPSGTPKFRKQTAHPSNHGFLP
jgi:CheY-like chemotaxis protein